jgi:hypothetical protein
MKLEISGGSISVDVDTASFMRKIAATGFGLWMLTTVRYVPGSSEVVVWDVPGMLLVQMNFTAYWKANLLAAAAFARLLVAAFALFLVAIIFSLHNSEPVTGTEPAAQCLNVRPARREFKRIPKCASVGCQSVGTIRRRGSTVNDEPAGLLCS